MSDDIAQLDILRHQINDTDKQLLQLLAKRRDISLAVANYKIKSTKPIRDIKRERSLMGDLIEEGKRAGLDAEYIGRVFQVVIEDSVLQQQTFIQRHTNQQEAPETIRIAYLGPQGSYSHLALLRYFPRRAANIVEQSCSSFRQIIEQVENGLADYAVLPIENTSSGGINEVYDLLQHTPLSITGELTVPVEHCLLTAVPTELSAIKTIYSHFQPVAQCNDFLATLGDIQIEQCDSSSDALTKVAELKRPDIAAIGNKVGGELYGLEVLTSGIANQKENFSRFIVVARKAVKVASQIPAKTTLIMSVGQQPGALVDALLIIKQHDLSLRKLESRPIQGNPWEEMFYVDILANLTSQSMQDCLVELEKSTNYLKVLGCYPSDDVSRIPLTDALK